MVLQLLGHLCGCALQEWGLLDAGIKKSYADAVAALRTKLDPSSQMFAAQEFRHTSLVNDEKVAHFTWRLEHTFNVMCGR